MAQSRRYGLCSIQNLVDDLGGDAGGELPGMGQQVARFVEERIIAGPRRLRGCPGDGALCLGGGVVVERLTQGLDVHGFLHEQFVAGGKYLPSVPQGG